MGDYPFRGEVGIRFHPCAIFNPSILDKIMFPRPHKALESWLGAGVSTDLLYLRVQDELFS